MRAGSTVTTDVNCATTVPVRSFRFALGFRSPRCANLGGACALSALDSTSHATLANVNVILPALGARSNDLSLAGLAKGLMYTGNNTVTAGHFALQIGTGGQ